MKGLKVQVLQGAWLHRHPSSWHRPLSRAKGSCCPPANRVELRSTDWSPTWPPNGAATFPDVRLPRLHPLFLPPSTRVTSSPGKDERVALPCGYSSLSNWLDHSKKKEWFFTVWAGSTKKCNWITVLYWKDTTLRVDGTKATIAPINGLFNWYELFIESDVP